MPSQLAKWCRADPLDASMANWQLLRARWCPPRPFRSTNEAEMIKRFVFQWWRNGSHTPSGREWARQLGISNTWLLKLIRSFAKDPTEMLEIQRANGDPKFSELERAREESQEMRRRGELRPLRYKHYWHPRKEKRVASVPGRIGG